MASDVAAALTRALVSYLSQTVPRLAFPEAQPVGALVTAVRESFPEPEVALIYPVVTVHAASDELYTHSPVFMRAIGTPSGVNGQISRVLYAVGRITAMLQVDVWANSKPQRREVLEALRRDLRGEILEGGSALNLPLPEMFDEPAVFRVAGGGTFADTEFAAQRREWRATLTVEAECRELIEASQTLLKDLETRTSLCLPIDILPEPPAETRQVF